MEEILKSLQGKSMTKKSLFDFLSEINIKDISSVKPTNTIIYDDIVIHPMNKELNEEPPKEKKRRGRKPKEKPLVEEPPKEKKRRGRKPREKPLIEEPREKNVSAPKLKCDACMKIFLKESYLKHHQNKHTVCKDWLQLSEKSNLIKLKKGIHLIINDLLNKTISDNDNLECKFCKCKFSNKGNHHKHYTYSTVCNSMAYDEFKKNINNII